MRNILALSCTAGFFVLAQPVAAQNASAEADSPETASTSGEIIVTAQRRSQRLIDVPATISVLSADSLAAASISSTLELAQMTPGLQVSNTGAYTQFALRGVSSETSGPGADNNVAIYVDGVYTPSKNTGIFDFPDIESIEVLKGPQGTLYGRNATGGAILFRTAEPTFEPSGMISASYGSFNDREVKAVASTGLASDKVAVSVAGYYRNSDGYLKDLVNVGRKYGGVESYLLRGKLLFAPSSSVKITLSGYYSNRKDREAVTYYIYNGNTNGVLFNPKTIIPKYGEYASGFKPLYRNEIYGFSARAEISTAAGNLSATSGYTNVDNLILTDGDATSVTGIDYLTVQPQKTFSQELNFASRKFGPFSFLAGASYLTDVGRWDPVRVFSGGKALIDIDAKVKTEAIAAYFDGTLALTDRLDVSAGLRWTTEKKDFFGGNNAPTFPYIASKRWNNVSPSASIKYALNDQANVYASYSRGFKSGLFNAATFTGQTVNPEIVDAFEMGVKAHPSAMLTISASAFYYDYKNIQVVVFQGLTQALQNAAKAKIYGLDIDATFQPIPDLTFKVGLSPLHTRYESYPSAVVLAPTPTSLCPTGFTYCGNRNYNVSLTGSQLSRAPRFTANGSVSYTLRAGSQSVNFFANVYYTDKFYWDASNRLAQDGYVLINGRISWNINNGPFSVEVWAKNLTDEKYATSSGINSSKDGFVTARPRTVGGTIKATF